MSCTCACHELEENHDPDECYCMIGCCKKCGSRLSILRNDINHAQDPEEKICLKCEAIK